MSLRYTPGKIHSVEAGRVVRVEIPGLTDGAASFPVADVLYPVGDRSNESEIKLLPGDLVWLDFVNDDPNYPVVINYRTGGADDIVGTRRISQNLLEFIAAQNMKIEATSGTVTIKAGTKLVVQAPAEFQQPVEFKSAVTQNGVNIGAPHTHTSAAPGSPTGPVIPAP